MLRLEHSVIIDRPREVVFDFVTNTANVTQWKSGLVEVRRRSTAPVGVGTIETHVSRFLGRQNEMDHEITEYEPHRLVRFRTTSGPFPSAGRFIFDEVDGATKLTIVSEAEPPAVYRLLALVFAPVARRRLRRDLATLKRVLEQTA